MAKYQGHPGVHKGTRRSDHPGIISRLEPIFASVLVQNTTMADSERSLPFQLWLAEAISHLERDGWLDDSVALRGLTASSGGPFTTRRDERQVLVLGRTNGLNKVNPIVRELANELEAFRATGKLLAIALAVFAILGGAATAAAVLSNGTVNVVLAWSALLGVHLMTLVAWCLGLAFAGQHLGFTRSGWWSFVTQKLLGSKHRLLLVQAMTTLVARTRLVFWTYSLASHALWSLFLFSAVVTLTYLFALHEYRFTWETTILPPTFFVQFVDTLGWLPSQFGIPPPTPDAVTRLTNDEATRQAWAAWILSGVVAYGLLPRVLLTALSHMKRARHTRSLALDLEQPHYVRLLQRIDAQLKPDTQIVDPAPDHAQDLSVMQTLPSGLRDHRTSVSGLIVGFELHDDVAWPPAELPTGVLAEANLSSLAEREALLRRVARTQPERLVVACDARSGLDRGTLHYLDEVARHSGALGILLLNQATARAGRADNWKEELIDRGIPAAAIFAELAGALEWLEAVATPAPSPASQHEK